MMASKLASLIHDNDGRPNRQQQITENGRFFLTLLSIEKVGSLENPPFLTGNDSLFQI